MIRIENRTNAARELLFLFFDYNKWEKKDSVAPKALRLCNAAVWVKKAHAQTQEIARIKGKRVTDQGGTIK